MPEVKFLNDGEEKSVDVPEGTLISEAIKRAGISFEFPCNGMGFCGKCLVTAKGEMEKALEDEKRFIDINKNERLACCAKVIGDTTVCLIKRDKEIKTINSGLSLNIKPDSQVKLIELGSIDFNSPVPLEETIKYRFSTMDIYSKLAMAETLKNSGALYGVVYNNELLDILTDKSELLAAAVDIGTTGISAYLVNTENGDILKKISSLNPQTEYGGDVISRINFCMKDENGTLKLQRLIVDEVNRILKELTGHLYSTDQIYNLTIAGNTTMIHLLLGLNPSSMAMAPYRPVVLNTCIFKASEAGIIINPNGKVITLPGASAYVGADIIAGITASGFNKMKSNAVFIDIGTNGEIAAISNGRMICTSTAAGPALEGMNISCGCRAEKGAIESFNIDEEYNISYTTIDDGEPAGICGSGLLDIAGNLLNKGIILESGSFNKDMDIRVISRFVEKKFFITDKIYISQKDIRQIQLAKGAIAAGIISLLEKINISIQDLEEIIIAGAFGYHINAESILGIGLIPKGFNGKITFAGNTSIEGARLAAINQSCLAAMDKIKCEMDTLELSMDNKFQEYFIKELNF